MKHAIVNLRRVLHDGVFVNWDDAHVAQVRSDSRLVKPGDAFAAISGLRSDGHTFIHDAVKRGASGVIAERRVDDVAVPQCVVPDSAKAFATLSMALQGSPASRVTTAGVTGTNGKTTTTYLLRSILNCAGLQAGMIGTIENSNGQKSRPSTMTTPAANVLATQFAGMVDRQASHCVMEVSSHALEQKRCVAVPLSVAAITNVTQDHFDYHGTAAGYRHAKAKIAELLHPDAPLLVNLDDNGCRQIMADLQGSCRIIPFALDAHAAELRAEVLSKTHRSQRIRLHLAQGTAEARLRLIGRHNVSNSLLAAGLAEQLGVGMSDIVLGLESTQAIPGRLERIDQGQPFQVLVDYAHTPDALHHSIRTIRNFVPGRLICVFGAGGDRDRSKRPLMGAAATAADVAIVTSDNPRSESPQRIIAEIVTGFAPGTVYLTETDRRSAIAQACQIAEPGDVVLIAGKGHESYQEVDGRLHPFDDRIVVRQILLERESDHGVMGCSPVFSLQRPR